MRMMEMLWNINCRNCKWYKPCSHVYSYINADFSAVYDSTNQKVVIAYHTGNNYYGTAVVGTVSGTSIW